MPVATEVRGISRHDHKMPSARPDLLQAARADVGLVGLKGMDQANLDRPAQRGIKAQSRIPAITAKATSTMT